MILPLTPKQFSATPATSVHWSRAPLATATPEVRFWLQRPGALTAGLRELGELNLTVITEVVGPPNPSEQQALGGLGMRAARIREIQMALDGQVCIVARSVLSLAAWRGSWRALRGLGHRPLADLLYDDPYVKRSHFESARLRHPERLAKLAGRLVAADLAAAHQALWARRSVFWRQGHALLVTECFLPVFWEIALQKASQRGKIGR